MGNTTNDQCSGCDLGGSSFSSFGRFYYYDPAGSIAMSYGMGICYDCGEITAVECFPDSDLRSLFLRLRDEELDAYERQRIAEEYERVEYLQGVDRDPVCLSCGGTDIQRLRGENDRHRDCGGTITSKSSGWYISPARKTSTHPGKVHYYDRRGRRVYPEVPM